MTITTSKQTTHEVNWIDCPIGNDAVLTLSITDPRLLSEIAVEFEGLERIDRFDESQGDKTYLGYTVLKQIMRSNGEVWIWLERGA